MDDKRNPSFEELSEEFSQPLFGYLRRMSGNAADADDLLQETLLKIAKGLSTFEHRSSVKTWAFRIATNVAIDFLRRSAKAQFIEFDESDRPSGIDEEERLILDEMNSCVREVIDRLPPDYRAAVVLFHLEGRTLAEISEICSISLAATKVRVHRARARLQEALNKECTFYSSGAGNLRCARKDCKS
ncbi:RNA polymerase sigma factor [Oligoflexia bacterium]|nr:RNA polymerase sigma factor [Oligoflexia bacterium]